MYGLRKIIQIDGFIKNLRTPIDVDGHSMVSGTNGAGKSSTLKLLSFFYGGPPSQLDNHASGRGSFLDFYLPRPSSMIIFEYERESGICSVVVTRHSSGTKHVYRFLSSEYKTEHFSCQSASGEMKYLRAPELAAHWKVQG
jgi:ABC-type molybdenum transport system ATPase subunit/photorepair protein PhrA